MPMVIASSKNWLKGDNVKPVPADGVYLYGNKVLMPALHVMGSIITDAYPAKGMIGRDKLLRSAFISYAKNKDWQPTAAYDDIKEEFELIKAKVPWDRMDIKGALIHYMIPQHEAATTVDIIATLGDKGLGILAIWPMNLGGLHENTPWAEMGSTVATLADRGIFIDVCSLIKVSKDKVKIELKDSEEALSSWVAAIDIAKMNRKRIANELSS